MNEIVVDLRGAEAPVVQSRGLARVPGVARWVAALCAVGLVFAFAVLRSGSNGTPWNLSLAVIGGAAAVYWLSARGDDRAPALDPLLLTLVSLAPAYVLLQLIPLPLFLVDVLSPGRSRLTDLVNAVTDVGATPLSIDPFATLAQLVGVVGCVVTFLLVRDLSWTSRQRVPAAALLPIVAIGLIESIIGLAQAAMRLPVRGTFATEAALGCLLEAALPLTIGAGIVSTLRPSARRQVMFVRPWAGVATLIAAAILIGAMVASGSRTTFVAALCGVLAMGSVATTSRMKPQTRIAILLGLLTACAFVAVSLPLDRIVSAFASGRELTTARRALPVWGDSLRLAADYPLAGAGLGTFESAFPKYQTAATDAAVAAAGNDYLQLVAEAGLLGAPLFIALLITAHRRSGHAASTSEDWTLRLLHMGCTGAITAIGVHGFLGSNLQVPVNALLLAWIAGFAVSAPSPAPVAGLARRWVLAPACALVLLTLLAGFRESPRVAQALCRIGVCSQEMIAADANTNVNGPANRVSALTDALIQHPASAAAWCDLGDAMHAGGRANEARTAFANAVSLAPSSPAVRERVAQFYFELGETPRALVEGAVALDMSAERRGRVIDMYLRRGVTVDAVLARGLPAGAVAAGAYLRALLGADRASDAATAWTWVTAHRYADDSLARDFIHYLFARGEYEQAAHTWAGYVGDRATGYLQSSFVFDGGFESTSLGTEFDWHIGGIPERVVVDLDPQVARRGRRSLRIRFGGTDNVEYHHTRQMVFVTPGVYRFSALVRAMGVTTDQGLAFHLFDAAEPRNVDLWTPAIAGTTSWTPLEETVTVPDGVSLLTLEITRRKSEQFDSHIAGTLWIDDVALTKIEEGL